MGHSRNAKLAGMLLVSVACLLTAGSSLGQCNGTPTYQETYVDPEFLDCNTGLGWHGSAWGGGGAAADTFDQDAAYGNVLLQDEDLDVDAVCGTIQSAINSTLTGGTVHVLVPGVYREALTVARSMTIRGGEGMDVIIDGGNGVCTAGPTAGPGIDITATTSVVRLENLTVRNFATGTGFGDGVRITGTTTAVTIVDCRIQDNEADGIAHPVGSASLDVIGSEIIQNENGISQSGANAVLTVIDTVIANNTNDGITSLGGEVGWGTITMDRSQASNNGRHGINIDQNLQSVGGALVVHDSGVSHNLTDGIHASITNGNATTTIAVSDSLFGSNGGDGMHLTGGDNHLISVRASRININAGDGIEVDAAWTLNIVENMFASNGGFCINNAALTPVACDPGYNQFIPLPPTCMANMPPAGFCPTGGGQNQ